MRPTAHQTKTQSANGPDPEGLATPGTTAWGPIAGASDRFDREPAIASAEPAAKNALQLFCKEHFVHAASASTDSYATVIAHSWRVRGHIEDDVVRGRQPNATRTSVLASNAFSFVNFLTGRIR